jgi:hypothetical protein
MKRLICILCLLSLLACKKTDNGWRIITINSGHHYSDTWRGEIVSAIYNFQFIMDENCMYDETAVDAGWNKIGGWSEVDGTHSVRIGWRCDKGLMIVGYYIHSYGRTISGKMDTIKPGFMYQGRVAFEDNGYTVEINGKRFRMSDAHRPIVCWREYFYFGGGSPAPHNLTIKIKNN